MKTIVLFSIHRTGTNYLHSVLRQFPSLSAFGEVFHPDRVYHLKPVHWKAISALSGREFSDGGDPAFIAWARSHPVDLVEALCRPARRKDKDGVYLKVFVGQWQVPVAATVAALAARPGFVPIVLQRRPLDVYVSYRKAERAGEYKHVDTTDSPEALDAAAYARWAATARGWYREVDEALAQAGTQPIRVTYERDIDMAPDALVAHWSRLLGVPGPDALDPEIVLARQDRSPDLAAKIANHDEFLSALDARGLRREAETGFAAGGESLDGASAGPL